MSAVTEQVSPRQQARDLYAAGHSMSEIARMLGRPRSTVGAWCDPDHMVKQKRRRKRYQRPCPDCGTMMDGSGGFKYSPAYCTDCSHLHQHYDRRWTPETIIEAIQRWALTHDGQPPAARDWLVGHRGEDYPAVATVMANFGSWANAIEAAGFSRPRIGAYPRDGRKGMGRLQYLLLDLLREHGRLSTTELMRLSGRKTAGHVQSTLVNLEKRGLVVRTVPHGYQRAAIWERV